MLSEAKKFIFILAKRFLTLIMLDLRRQKLPKTVTVGAVCNLYMRAWSQRFFGTWRTNVGSLEPIERLWNCLWFDTTCFFDESCITGEV